MTKCKHCLKIAYCVFNNDFLCEHHYKKLYLNVNNKTPIRLVPKTHLESKLKIKYMKLMKNYITNDEFSKMLENFKIDVEIIKKENKIYSKV